MRSAMMVTAFLSALAFPGMARVALAMVVVGSALAGEFGDDFDVLQGGQRGHQIEELEHENDPVTPVGGASIYVE